MTLLIPSSSLSSSPAAAFILTAPKLALFPSSPSTRAREALRAQSCSTRRTYSHSHSRSPRVTLPTGAPALNDGVRGTPTMSLLPFLPNWLVMGGWLFGAYRFYLGFNRTSYQPSFRIPLALAWPLLFVFNGSYRKNFMRSIEAGNDDY